MKRQLRLFGQLGRMIAQRKLYFLIPFFSLLIFAILLLIALESPALLPFFYAIF